MRRKISFINSMLICDFYLKGLAKSRYIIMRTEREASKMVWTLGSEARK